MIPLLRRRVCGYPLKRVEKQTPGTQLENIMHAATTCVFKRIEYPGMMHILRRTSNNITGWAAPIPGSRFSSSQPHPNPSTTVGSEPEMVTSPPRPYEDLPGPKGLPFIGTVLDYSGELSHGDGLGAAARARYGRCGMLLGNNAHLSCGCHALM